MAEPQTISIEIDAAPQQVFALVADPDQRRRWVDELEATIPMSPGPIGQGSRFTMRIREGDHVKDYPAEVTAYEPNRRFAIRFTRGPMVMTVDYRLEPTMTGSRLHATVTTSSTSRLMRMAGSLAAGMARSIMERQLARLKEVAEAAA